MRLRSKAADLAKRVNSGVGAAGAMQNDVLLREAAQNANNLTLNRGLACLNLPAVEISAVVRDGELEITHGEEVISFRLSVFRRGERFGKFIISTRKRCERSGSPASSPRFRRGKADNLLPRSWRWAIESATALPLRSRSPPRCDRSAHRQQRRARQPLPQREWLPAWSHPWSKRLRQPAHAGRERARTRAAAPSCRWHRAPQRVLAFHHPASSSARAALGRLPAR